MNYLNKILKLSPNLLASGAILPTASIELHRLPVPIDSILLVMLIDDSLVRIKNEAIYIGSNLRVQRLNTNIYLLLMNVPVC